MAVQIYEFYFSTGARTTTVQRARAARGAHRRFPSPRGLVGSPCAAPGPPKERIPALTSFCSFAATPGSDMCFCAAPGFVCMSLST